MLLLWFLTVTCSWCLYLYFSSAIMLVTYFVNFRQLNDHLFGKELFIRFTASAFRKLPSVYVFSYFPFGFEGRMWDLIVSVPDHCLSFYFLLEPVCVCVCGGDSVASGLKTYNLQTTLIQYDSIYTKIWARYWKNPVPPSSVITEHCACASRVTRPDSPMRHIDTDGFLHDMAHITYHI